MHLSEETVKQIFFYCDQHEPNAVVADDVDIVQFAHKIAAYVEPIIAFREHQRCVQIVTEMNREVGNSLNNQRPKF
jgi:hypothetical protein